MLPRMIPLFRTLSGPVVADVSAETRHALKELRLDLTLRPGARVGVPVGSRGIRDLVPIIHTVVEHLRETGAKPFIAAAMGSHGGGTGEGQTEILSGLGVTADALGVPVIASSTSVEIGRTLQGVPLYFDASLAHSDGIIVINRIKPHTSFHGRLESGLVKMLVVGCGKAEGARQFHAAGPLGIPERLRELGSIILERVPVLGGIAILENARKETAEIHPVRASELFDAEERLLYRARDLQPSLPTDKLDLLIVDQIGKEIAGTGMDTNVIGRIGIRGVPDSGPTIGRIIALDLSAGSHGNANGVGLADITTLRLARKIDFHKTYLNCLTATFVERAKLPIALSNDREAIETALRTLGSPTSPRIIRIANTLELERIRVSPAVLNDMTGPYEAGHDEPWAFDEEGNLF